MPPRPSFTLRAAVTGAAGFVGRALMPRLAPEAMAIHLGAADWQDQVALANFRGVTVFHLAARVHRSIGAEAAYVRDNVEKTRVLAATAASGGARRFVFLSSIKVNGEETWARPFGPDDAEAPADAYARSKWAAERVLRDISRSSALPVTIVRSPLIVGPGVRGNLASLVRLADTPWPLPFAAVDNRRTLVHVDDLASLLCLCASLSEAEGRTFLAGDPIPVSTPRLVATLRSALGRPTRLTRVDPTVLEMAAALVGKRATVRRLTRSLEIDISATRRDLGWASAVSLEEGITGMIRAYRMAPSH